MTTKVPNQKTIVKLALLKGLENHNIALYLKHPVTVVKAFGIRKTAKVLLISIDKPKAFMESLKNAKPNNVFLDKA